MSISVSLTLSENKCDWSSCWSNIKCEYSIASTLNEGLIFLSETKIKCYKIVKTIINTPIMDLLHLRSSSIIPTVVGLPVVTLSLGLVDPNLN